ncbi:MAG TPA: TonB-dependent receptor [Candidatus Eisenbacteria bacterium]|jgi:hypothetical protein
MDLLLALAILVSAPETAASIVGTVRDAQTLQPLAGAAVLLPDLERGARTDSIGRYLLARVPPGPHHLEVRRLGYAPRTLHALVPRTGTLEIDVTLLPEPVSTHAIEVRAPVVVRGVEPGTTVFPDREVSGAAIANHPLLAEPDGFHALGGGDVVLRPETAGGVHIRGGATDQTGFVLDGVPVLSPYHAAGLSSAWNSDALARLYLRSSEPSTSGPDALSGTIEGVTREPGAEPRSQGSVSTTQARVTLDGPMGPAGYVLSARGGVHDLVAPRDERSYLAGGTGDALAKLEAPMFGGHTRTLFYGNTNRIGTAAVAEEPMPIRPRNRFEWDGGSFGLEWKHTLARGEFRILGWAASGDASADWAMPVGRIEMEADRHDVGASLTIESHRDATIDALELRGIRSRTSYRTTPDSAGSRFALESDTPVATLLARHAGPIGLGLELEATTALTLADQVLRGAPRARLSWSLPHRLTFSGAYLRTHQYAQSLRNAESVVGNVFPADVTVGIGAAGIPVAESDQGVLGADWRPAPGVRLGLEAYERRSRSLVLVAPRDGEPFTTGAFAIGDGRARGLALDLSAGAARWGLVASYGWQRVRFSYGDSSYVPEHGAAHLLEGGVIVYPTATTSVRLGASAAMGRHTTSIPGAFEWESCNLRDQGCEFGGSPHYGGEPLGGTPLPAYARLDLGLRQHWHLKVGGRDGLVALFGTYSNLLGRRNLLTYAYDPASGDRMGIELRPAAPLVVGLDWRY